MVSGFCVDETLLVLPFLRREMPSQPIVSYQMLTSGIDVERPPSSPCSENGQMMSIGHEITSRYNFLLMFGLRTLLDQYQAQTS